MNLRIRILSVILGASMLFSCVSVGAEGECFAQVAAMKQKIEKNVGAMSLSTEGAWDVYIELIRAYDKYFLNKKKLMKFYDVVCKLEYNVQRMSIKDSNLNKSISALYCCYAAGLEECRANYDSAWKKWKEAYEIYSLINLAMKDTKYTHEFNFMVDHCEYHMDSCEGKKQSYVEYCEEFFDNIVVELRKVYEERLYKEMEFLEDTAIYEVLEYLRFFINHREKLPLDKFIEEVEMCSMLVGRHIKVFRYMNDEFPGFVDKLEKRINKFIKDGNDFEKHSDYSSAVICYFMARVFLRFTGKSVTDKVYTHVTSRIARCKERMEKLGKKTFF